MDPSKVRPVIDRRSWPYQLTGYRMKLGNDGDDFQAIRNPPLPLAEPATTMFEGMSPVQAGAEYIDNDNYAMEFNRKFFVSGARPAGFLEDRVHREDADSTPCKIGFAEHARRHREHEQHRRIAERR